MLREEPVLKTTCIQRPRVYQDQLVIISTVPAYRDHLCSETTYFLALLYSKFYTHMHMQFVKTANFSPCHLLCIAFYTDCCDILLHLAS